MPTPLVRPTNLELPFAKSGTKNAIPIPTTGTRFASYNAGFPPITMQPIASGGEPPEGPDFNGIFYDITTHTLWVNAGGQYLFDAALAAYIGGYPVGMVLQNNAGTASYVNAVANNSTDFNSTPAAIGVSWLPYAGQATSGISVATTGGTTVLTAIQSAAKQITITGVLASNATITVPAALGEWEFINNTTGGSYTVTVIALAGAGVPILRGGADKVFCDGTDVRYVESSAITQPFGTSSKAIANMEALQTAVSAVAAPGILLFFGNFH